MVQVKPDPGQADASPMIEVCDLVFEYPGKRALDGVSFSLPAGSITALVGPNGAGKTTLMRCLAALEEPMSGSIRIGGVDVAEDPRSCHQRVGYLSDFFGLYDELRVDHSLAFIAGLHGIAVEDQPGVVAETADRVGIQDLLYKSAGSLSRGQRQRLGVAQAIIHGPRIVLLDEPASGLDPEARHELSSLLLDLQARGMTVVVSSHILAELDEYSSRMLILRDGAILESRALEEIDAPTRVFQLQLAHGIEDAAHRLSGVEGVENVSVRGLEAQFEFRGDRSAQSELLRRWIEGGLPIASFGETRSNLQDLYREKVRGAEAEPRS